MSSQTQNTPDTCRKEIVEKACGPQPTPEEILDQLDQLLSSPAFQKSERMAQFLRFVVMQTLDGKADRIKQRTVAMEVYGRGGEFDPRTDPIVRIEATRLRRLLDAFYQAPDCSATIRINLRKGGYVPDFQVIPEAICAVQGTGEVSVRTTPRGGPSLAVAFFRNATHQRDKDFVPLGITEELLARLTCFSELVVLGPLQGSEHHQDALRQARQIQAQFLLDGQVNQFCGRLRVSASLTDVSHGQTLWAEQFDRDLSAPDLFAIQDEIAETIAGTVADDFGVITRSLTASAKAGRTDSLQSYKAVLQARSWLHSLDNASLLKAYHELEIAVREDTHYALTKALLSDIYAIDHHLQLGLTGHAQPLDIAEKLAREAVALDAYCQTSAWCLAGVHFHRRREQLCVVELERTLALNPNHPQSIANCGLFFTMLGAYDRGIELIRKSMRLNPHYPSWYHFCLVLDHYRRKEFELALPEASKFQSPDLFWPPLLRAAVLGQLGRQEDALPEMRELLDRVPDFHERGRQMMRLTVYRDEHVEMLFDGLLKAGLSNLKPLTL
jgi:adenylate cyclase